MGKEDKYAYFSTVSELYCELIGIDKVSPADFTEFEEWLKSNKKINIEKIDITYEEI